VGLNVIGELSSDQKISPILLCELDRLPEPIELTCAHLERGKANSLQFQGSVLPFGGIPYSANVMSALRTEKQSSPEKTR
jgi:hypothetical protein